MSVQPPVDDIVSFYLEARKEAATNLLGKTRKEKMRRRNFSEFSYLTDGNNQKPHYSLRTLTRGILFHPMTSS